MTSPQRFRDCRCPGTPHTDGDTVTLREALSFTANSRALSLIFSSEPNLATNAMPVYLHEGPIAWNLLNEDGEPISLDKDAIDALSFADQYEIADLGDSKYRDTVLSPLAQRTKALSKAGPTPAPSKGRSSTSRTRS